jgi:hypothetical protein
MSHPGFINGLAIYGPPLPPELLARRNAAANTKRRTPTQQQLAERSRGNQVSDSSEPQVPPDEAKCRTCHDLQLRKEGDDQNLPSSSKVVSVQGLQISASMGCPACCMLLDGITKSDVSLDDVQDIMLNSLRANATLVVILTRGAVQEANTYLEFYQQKGKYTWACPGSFLALMAFANRCTCYLARRWPSARCLLRLIR